MHKDKLWLLMTTAHTPHVHAVIPTVAWIAKRNGVKFEAYLESERDGQLFAASGSTVLGGNHHLQFNYLYASFDISLVLYGKPTLFESSIQAFGAPILAKTDNPFSLYQKLLGEEVSELPVMLLPDTLATIDGVPQNLGPYFFPEVYFREALGLPVDFIEQDGLNSKLHAVGFRTEQAFPETVEIVDSIESKDTLASITTRIAQRWKHRAKGVFFGDPAVILSQLATVCREERVAVYAPRQTLPPAQIQNGAYTEEISAIAEETAQLAIEIGNRVLAGRQTGDGDILTWSKSGVCIQIADPNRPVFPVVDQVVHPWSAQSSHWLDGEPDDAQLIKWADEGRVLSTLIWHSGEVAHNEAMLALCDLAGWYGLKMGIAVHAQRYETAPQTWELIQTARESGGMRGLIEPVLHSGGLGVMAEANCPPQILDDNIAKALSRIEAIAGPDGRPRGYYAFLDTDLSTLTQTSPLAYEAAARNRLEYFISSASPGRNRILFRRDNFVTLNQSCRVVHGGSPFVRVTHAEDLNTWPGHWPGWIIGVLDSPVVAFGPYVWRQGRMFMELAERIKSNGSINVLPHTISRYARLLSDRGILPAATPNHS